nr:L-threonylcarbamoyladenylate synthase [uncultured Dethiosulfovibrio sp.]
MIVKLDRWNPDKEAIMSAVKILQSGGLVAFPTETVYGLGANGLDGKAVSSIYSAKGRPSDNPLILHFGTPEDVSKVATVDERAKKIMDLFWPGPLTLVLPVRGNVPEEVTAGLETVGVRMPSHPVALALLQACRFPVAAPSANASGRPSPTDAQTVATDLKERVDMILDGGPTDLGLESTVLDVTGDIPVLLRPGGFPLEALVGLLGPIAMPKGELELKRSPGTRYRHYAPSLPMRIQFPADPFPVGEGEKWAFVGVDQPSMKSDRSILFDDLDAYGRGLFAAMRELERLPLDVIIAQWPGESGVGLAIRDRLIRASGLG